MKDAEIFHPEYTHQIFEDEKIRGYKGLSINIFFNASTLNPCIDISFQEKQQDQHQPMPQNEQGKLKNKKIAQEQNNNGVDRDPSVCKRKERERENLLEKLILFLNIPPRPKINAYIDNCRRCLGYPDQKGHVPE